MKTLAMACVLVAGTMWGQDTSPQTIYVHGNVLTGVGAERVQALAVTNSTVVAVGSDDSVMKLKGARTEVVDLGGAFVMPGFNDAHTHMASAGLQRMSVNIFGTRSLEEFLARIKAYTATAAPGTWIVGGGWDHTMWPGAKLPTRQDLDAVTAGHPAVFRRVDGHIVVANSVALLAAGISAATPDPEGGQIDKDAGGTPTGIVRELPAIALLEKKIPPATTEARRKGLEIAIDDAVAHGVTSVQDWPEWEDWLVLESMEHTGKLKVRVSAWMTFDTPLATLKDRRATHDPKDPMLHLGMLKALMDGSLGSRTAAMEDSYADDPNNSGIPRYGDAQINQMATERAAAGFQLGFHAIGDEANTMALNAFEAAEQTAIPADHPAPPMDPDAGIVTTSQAGHTPADLRFRIEHAQVLLPGDFERFHQLGVIASMQPSHLLTDMNWAGARLGPERSKYAYAWRSMLEHHVVLAFGTDYPVEPISPFRGLYAAVTRKNEAGTMSFHPEQTVTIEQAIYAYTQGSAFAEFEDQRLGRLEPGFLADFVVLDRDVTRVAPAEILGTKVLRTVVGGKTVFQQ